MKIRIIGACLCLLLALGAQLWASFQVVDPTIMIDAVVNVDNP